MQYYPFDSRNTIYKSIFGAIASETSLKLRLLLHKDAKVHNVYLCITKDGEDLCEYRLEPKEFLEDYQFFDTSLTFSEGIYWYYFRYTNDFGSFKITKGEHSVGIISNDGGLWQLTVYEKDFKTPTWLSGGIIYQIFPDRFYKQGTMPDITGKIARKWGEEPYYRPNVQGKVLNNDFFGGNFQGIQQKLPYLKQLGVTVIYLNPIFEAASNHRYDTSDYMKLDPILGTEEDFKNLVQAAENQGIRIILDGVFNHTGDDSVYFNKYGHYASVGAYQSKDSPYYSWYTFTQFPDKYESWWGIDILPEVNEKSEEYQNFIFGKNGVLKKWLRFGIGGYRLDVADELPDFFLKNLRKSVKESNPDAIIIGEVWEDASNKIAYSQRREYLHGYELDSVMNYPLKEALIEYIKTENAAKLLHSIRVLINHYPKQTVDCLMNILGTHDTARILTVLGGIHCKDKEEMATEKAYLKEKDKENAIEKLKIAAVLQYTLPGVPCLYYGDENGLEGHIDPFCRRCFDWEHLNEDLIGFYSRLGTIREEYREVFKNGEFAEIRVENGLFIYKRENENGCVYIYVNNSSKRHLLQLPEKIYELLTNVSYGNQMEIQPYAYGIFVKQ